MESTPPGDHPPVPRPPYLGTHQAFIAAPIGR